MNRFLFQMAILLVLCLSSCTVKESIVFKENGSGEFLLSYDMADVMKQMKGAFGEQKSSESANEKKAKMVDTMMVFRDIMNTYKDSVAALPEEKQLALEAVKDMFMKMKVDEENGIFNIGIGLDFNSINELKGIQEKIEKAKGLNAQNDQVSAMKTGSPLGKFMSNDKNRVDYNFTSSGFSRTTSINEDVEEINFDEGDKQFLEYFSASYYIVEYTFPKKIKSFTIKGGELSADKKTITCRTNWIEFIKKPNTLDFDVEFE